MTIHTGELARILAMIEAGDIHTADDQAMKIAYDLDYDQAMRIIHAGRDHDQASMMRFADTIRDNSGLTIII